MAHETVIKNSAAIVPRTRKENVMMMSVFIIVDVPFIVIPVVVVVIVFLLVPGIFPLDIPVDAPLAIAGRISVQLEVANHAHTSRFIG
jgi:hypothetical protein